MENMVDAGKCSTYIDKVLLTSEGRKGNRQIIQQSVRSSSLEKDGPDRGWIGKTCFLPILL